ASWSTKAAKSARSSAYACVIFFRTAQLNAESPRLILYALSRNGRRSSLENSSHHGCHSLSQQVLTHYRRKSCLQLVCFSNLLCGHRSGSLDDRCLLRIWF